MAYPHRTAGLVISSPATGGMPAAALARMEVWLEQVARGGVRTIVDPMFAVAYPSTLRGRERREAQHRLRFMTVDPNRSLH